GAVVLSALGGVLILLDGLVYAFVGSDVQGVSPTGLGVFLQGAGYLAVFLGTLVVVLAVSLAAMPDSHRGLGILILTFSLLSLPVGGGFLAGAVIGWVGGVAGIVARLEPVPVGELESDWSEVLDDPVVEADLHDKGIGLPPIREPNEPAN
ncbi:MAG: hypothetical protein L3J87_00250, partial [Thermoplasmata archaeon]|nr:hypothetical protein [Thermoplasmata archaeon]